MALHPLAGQPAPQDELVNIPLLISAYYRQQPDIHQSPNQAVNFGTSGHRGSSLASSFNEHHILAIAQAIADYRKQLGLTGPLYLGKDTHALSEPAFLSCLEVLIGNGVKVRVQKGGGYTPTPVISHAILTHNDADLGSLANEGQADGLVITPSHNPPEDGGIKYNPHHGGPADKDATDWIAKRANHLIGDGLAEVKRASISALPCEGVEEFDYIAHYVGQLDQVINMKAIAEANIRIGVDPLGGSGIHFWRPIAEHYGLNIELVNEELDPRFAFMPLDKDGRIRMDCSSPYAMANLLKLQDTFDIAVGNDPDYDRHGIVCAGSGLMNPNAYLAVAINYLIHHRPDWSPELKLGKTLVSSAIIDRVVEGESRTVFEVPVGFKWYVQDLLAGELAFGGEESAGASFLRMNGKPWSTDKDGFILALLAAEILAVTGKDPAAHYRDLTARYGEPIYKRIDVPTSAESKMRLASLSVDDVSGDQLAGDPILRVLTKASGNDAAIGGLKVETKNGWFAARPSGTENIYKIYLESFVSEDHLTRLEQDAKAFVDNVLNN